jgi:diheme cytochrome c
MDSIKCKSFLEVAAWALIVAGLAFVACDAAAEGRLDAPANERWKTECGSCHIAYPPGLLPAQSWSRLMSGLERHFGTDAGVDPAAAAEIGAYLERYSASGKRARGAAGSLRITESAWFLREHDELSPAVWRRPAVKSAANCAACHTAAEQGDFRERSIRIPR